MKISAALFLASVASASAFAPAVSNSNTHSGSSGLAMVNDQREQQQKQATTNKNGVQSADGPVTPPAPKGPIKSVALPFVNAPLALDGSMAGDVGFDPLGLADSPANLTRYREAEIRHARLAMLAAAGWPLSELWDKKIASLVGMDPVLDSAGRVPSVLNGGMDRISPFYWVGCIGLAGAIELLGLANVSKKEGYFPGNYGFDPLGLYPTGEGAEKGQKWMQTAEIKNGRLAMLAITGFALQEFVTHISVIDQTPIFFKPITQVLMDQANNGYFIPEAATSAASDAAAATADVFSAADIASEAAATANAVASEAATAAPDAADVASAAAASTAEAATATAVEAVTTTPPPAEAANAAASASLEELTAAKQRIVELEDKLAAINGLAR